VVVMGDMARRFKLGSELMHATVTARLGTSIHGRLDSGILYTAAYIARIKAQASQLSLHPNPQLPSFYWDLNLAGCCSGPSCQIRAFNVHTYSIA
jgi:hypothetical protein